MKAKGKGKIFNRIFPLFFNMIVMLIQHGPSFLSEKSAIR